MTSLPTDRQLLEALVEPAFVLDVGGAVLAVNAAAQALGSGLPGQSFAEALLEEEERGGFAEVITFVRRGSSWAGELRIRHREGAVPTTVRVSPLRTDGSITGVLLLTDGVAHPASASGHGLADRLTRLAGVTAELISAEDVESVTAILIEHLADAAGATTASLSILVEETTLALVGLRGGVPGAASRWATYAVDDQTPAGLTVLTGQTLVMANRAEIAGRFPHLDLAAEGERSMVSLPLMVAGRVIGVATLSFPLRREFDPAELDFLRLLADQAAQALERIRAVTDATDQALKLQFVAEASAELAGSLDYESTLSKVAWLAVPRYADWCTVALAEDGVLRTIAVAHADPEKLAIAEEYLRRYPPDPEATTGSYEVLRTGQSSLTTQVTDEQLAAIAKDPDQLQLLRDLNFRSGLVVPLKARGRTLGTLTWVSGETGRRFGFSDVHFGEDLARRAAVAIDNALLHRELREVADHLQEAVRPAELPRGLPGWEMAALYSPAGRTEVGGDFYDVIPVDADRMVIFVGDVMGRGVQAAAAMSQIRAAVRTLVAVDRDPVAVMSGLDRLFEQFPTEQLVTLVYGVIDRSTDELTVAAAGHPPPIVLDGDGTGGFVESARGLILGAGGASREPAVVPFRVGQVLLLYTDGLLERRAEDLEVGKGRLLRRAVRLATADDLRAELDGLVADVKDPTLDDDLAVLVVRRLAPSDGHASD